MLDEESRIYCMRGRSIKLTSIENKVLSYLIEHKKSVVLYSELAEAVYEDTREKLPKKLVVWVHRLNEKLKGEIHIYSRKNIGYRIKYIGK